MEILRRIPLNMVFVFLIIPLIPLTCLAGHLVHGLNSVGLMTITNLSGNINAAAGQNEAYGLYSGGPMTITNLTGNINAAAGGDGAYGLKSGGPMIIGNLSGNINASASGNMACGASSRQSMTITNLSGNVSAASKGYYAYGLYSGGPMTITNFSANVSATAGQNKAYGLFSEGPLTIANLSGNITANAGQGSAYGMYIWFNSLTITNFSGNITANAGRNFAHGLYSIGPMTITNLTGNITANAGDKYAYGLYSIGPMTITNLTGNITANAGDKYAYGLQSNSMLNGGAASIPTLISGTISAKAKGLAVAIAAAGSMNVKISGTVSGVDTSGSGEGYAIRSGQLAVDFSHRPFEYIWRSNPNPNIITLDTGARLIGKVDLGTGNNTLNLVGTGFLDNYFKGITNVYIGDSTREANWTLDHVSGTFGNVTVNPHATLAVKGPVTVDGNYIHKKGGTYIPYINATDNKTMTTDKAVIEGGTLGVGIDTSKGIFLAGQTYNNSIIQAKNVSGRFDRVETTSPFFAAPVSYTPTAVNVALTRNSFDSICQTENECAMGRYVEGIYNARGMTDITDELFQLRSVSGIRSAYAQLAGLTHTAIAPVTFSVLNQYMDIQKTRMAGFVSGGPPSLLAAKPIKLTARTDTGNDANNSLLAAAASQMASQTSAPSWGLWMQGYGSLGERRANDISSKYDYHTAGLIIGFDRKVTPSFLVGAAAGYSYTKLDMNDLSESSKIDSYQASLYGTYKEGPFYINGMAAYGYNKYKVDRDIAFGGIFRSASTRYNGDMVSGYLEIGCKLPTRYVDIIPMASFQASYLNRNGFTEDDAGNIGLDVGSDRYTSGLGSLGLRMKKDYKVTQGILTPELRIRFDHEFSNDNYPITASFLASPLSTFTVNGDRPDKDRIAAGLGINWQMRTDISLSLSYDGYFSGDTTQHAGMAEFRYSF